MAEDSKFCSNCGMTARDEPPPKPAPPPGFGDPGSGTLPPLAGEVVTSLNDGSESLKRFTWAEYVLIAFLGLGAVVFLVFILFAVVLALAA